VNTEKEAKKLEALRKSKEEDRQHKQTKTCVCRMIYPKTKRTCDVLSCGHSLPKKSHEKLDQTTKTFLKNVAEDEKKSIQNKHGPLITMYSGTPGSRKMVTQTSHWNTLAPQKPSGNPSIEEAKFHATPHFFLDPLDVNPGSEDGVRVILTTLIEEAGQDRKIIPVVFDGGPLRVGHKLLHQEPAIFG